MILFPRVFNFSCAGHTIKMQSAKWTIWVFGVAQKSSFWAALSARYPRLELIIWRTVNISTNKNTHEVHTSHLLLQPVKSWDALIEARMSIGGPTGPPTQNAPSITQRVETKRIKAAGNTNYEPLTRPCLAKDWALYAAFYSIQKLLQKIS